MGITNFELYEVGYVVGEIVGCVIIVGYGVIEVENRNSFEIFSIFSCS